MSIYIQKQKQLETLKRQEKLFESQLIDIKSILNINTSSVNDKYLNLLKEQYDILDTYDSLYKEYVSLDNTKSLLLKSLLEDNSIDIVSFIIESDKPNNMLDILFRLGLVTGSQYEYVKDYLWKKRPSQEYKLQKSYYEG